MELYILILGTIAIAILTVIVPFNELSSLDFEDICMKFIMGAVGGCVLIFCILLVLFFSTIKTTTTTVNKEEKVENLVSMKFDNSINGEFYLGTGSINTDDYVVFYTKEKNEIVRNKLKADNLKILTDSDKPKVKIIVNDRITQNHYCLRSLNPHHENVYELEFHVPENSIMENINLN
ncbi:hypothetical protein N2W52_001932 [Clostridium perfringens]|nr:hypothetical protein [Clostridium perfringens]MDK0982945.1 hypothetical protein [Clostridium perfringens]